MANSLKEFRNEFIKSNDKIADISKYGDIPIELSGQDVHDYFLLFKNEDVAIDYIVTKYNIKKDTVVQELHEEDEFRKEFGKEKYLRSAKISGTLYIDELLDGTYILWKTY